MTSYLYYQYYYSYRDQRKYIKNLVQSNDIAGASTRLDNVITENDNYISQNNVTVPFAKDDNNSMHHARDHLNSFQSNGQSHQKDAIETALDEGY